MKRETGAIIINVLVTLAGAISIFPLVWMLGAGLMPKGSMAHYPPPIIPNHFDLTAFKAVLFSNNLWRYFVNSALISIFATLLALCFNVIAGYGFAKLNFKGRAFLYRLILIALLIPAQITMIPLFLMVKNMGLINSYFGVLLPWLSSAFGIFMVRQFAIAIPDVIIDAARIDGASEWQIFTNIIIPNLTPVLITLGLFTFIGAWNDFMWPLIILNDNQNQTLPVAIANLMLEHVQDGELMMAAAIITIIPILFIFLIMQKFYMRGLLSSGMRGN